MRKLYLFRVREILRECAFLTTIGLGILALAGALKEARAQENLRYEITKIVIPDPNSNFSGATHINEYGEVVGFFGQKHRENHVLDYELWRKAFLYKNKIVKDLDKFDIYGHQNINYRNPAINDLGEIVASKAKIGGNYTQKSSIYTLGQTTEIDFCGKDINNKGEVVGGKWLYSGGQIIELPSSPSVTEYNAINDSNQIVGYWRGVVVGPFPVLLENRVIATDFAIISHGVGAAFDINNNSKIVGYSGDESHAIACLWEKIGDRWLIKRLDTINSTAWAINDNGQVVGSSDLNTSLPIAVLYQKDKQNNIVKINLNDFLPENSEFERLVCALDINDKGQIVGYGEGRNEPGSQYAFVMTPIPKPSADLTEDGIVNFYDLAEFANQWLTAEP